MSGVEVKTWVFAEVELEWIYSEFHQVVKERLVPVFTCFHRWVSQAHNTVKLIVKYLARFDLSENLIFDCNTTNRYVCTTKMTLQLARSEHDGAAVVNRFKWGDMFLIYPGVGATSVKNTLDRVSFNVNCARIRIWKLFERHWNWFDRLFIRTVQLDQLKILRIRRRNL